MKRNVLVRSSNVARVMMDGKEIGLLQNVRMSDDYGPEPASGIGNIHAVEHVPTMARHSLSVSKLALRKTSLYKLGIVPENGDGALKGLIFDFEVFDTATGEVTRAYIGCSYASGDVEVSKHAIIAYNCQFNALDVKGKM